MEWRPNWASWPRSKPPLCQALAKRRKPTNQLAGGQNLPRGRRSFIWPRVWNIKDREVLEMETSPERAPDGSRNSTWGPRRPPATSAPGATRGKRSRTAFLRDDPLPWARLWSTFKALASPSSESLNSTRMAMFLAWKSDPQWGQGNVEAPVFAKEALLTLLCVSGRRGLPAHLGKSLLAVILQVQRVDVEPVSVGGERAAVLGHLGHKFVDLESQAVSLLPSLKGLDGDEGRRDAVWQRRRAKGTRGDGAPSLDKPSQRGRPDSRNNWSGNIVKSDTTHLTTVSLGERSSGCNCGHNMRTTCTLDWQPEGD